MADKTAVSEQEKEELTLKLWGGDDSAKADLVMRYATTVQKMIAARFRDVIAADIEDAVCEAIIRFWAWRDNYDPDQASIQTLLYRLAVRVIGEHRSGKYKWQKSKAREEAADPEWWAAIQQEAEGSGEDEEEPPSKLLRAVKKAFENLDPMQQEILGTYRDAFLGSHEVVAAELGVELGEKFKGGVPIPGGTVRVNKLRAIKRFVAEMKKLGFNMTEMGFINE